MKAAQLWEQQRGLPLRRMPGLRANAYTTGDRVLWVGDFRGERAILFVPIPHGLVQAPAPLVRLDGRGREVWRFVPGRTVIRGADTFVSPFAVRQFALVGDAIVVTSHHHLYYPSQIAVLSQEGRLLREYWHPGHLNVLTVGEYRGRTVVILGGVNNALHAATVVVLDPDRLAGAAVTNGEPAFKGFSPGVEEARLLLPRSCLSKNDPYNVVVQIVSGKAGTIVDVHDDMAAPASIQYHFAPGLQLTDVGVSDLFLTKHRTLRAANVIDHEWNSKEREQLHQVRRLP